MTRQIVSASLLFLSVLAVAAEEAKPAPAPAAAPAAKPAAAPAAKPAAAPAAKPAAKPAPKSQITCKLSQMRLSVYREKRPPEIQLKGQVRMRVSSELPRFKRPILNVVGLFDIGGVWRYYDVIVTDQKTSGGACLDKEHTVSRVSLWQPEVGMESWAQPVFGDSKSGFFRGYHIDESKAKLIAYRLEIWQNGALVTSYDSDKAALKRAGVPEDWYVKGKYGGKISYRWPPPPDKK